MNLLKLKILMAVFLACLPSFGGSLRYHNPILEKVCYYNFSDDYQITVEVYRNYLEESFAKKITEYICMGDTCGERDATTRFRYSVTTERLTSLDGTVLKLNCYPVEEN